VVVSEFDYIFAEKGGWLEAIPEYQRESFALLLSNSKTPAEVAQIWLTTSGPSNNFPYGGERFPAVFYEKLIDELEKLVCGDDKYAQQRQEILNGFGKGKAYVVVAIAVAIAPHLGAAEALLAPAVALILLTVSDMGVNAWCAARAELRQKLEEASG
jgi:hypothetical protein